MSARIRLALTCAAMLLCGGAVAEPLRVKVHTTYTNQTTEDRAAMVGKPIELSDQHDREVWVREQSLWARMIGGICAGCGGRSVRSALIDPMAVLMRGHTSPLKHAAHRHHRHHYARRHWWSHYASFR